MRRMVPTAIASAFVFASSATAWADPVVIIRDNRVVNAVENNFPLPERRSFERTNDSLAATVTSPAGSASGMGASTLESSFADPMRWFGAGTTTVSGTAVEDYEAASWFGITFQVTSPVTYEFAAAFTASYAQPLVCCGEPASSAAWLELFTGRRDEDGDPLFDRLFYFDQTHSTPDANRAAAGLLMPGEYNLWVMARSAGWVQPRAGRTTSDFAFTFDLAAADPVPEPASMLLLASGLVGVFRYRRRQRHTCDRLAASNGEPERSPNRLTS